MSRQVPWHCFPTKTATLKPPCENSGSLMFLSYYEYGNHKLRFIRLSLLLFDCNLYLVFRVRQKEFYYTPMKVRLSFNVVHMGPKCTSPFYLYEIVVLLLQNVFCGFIACTGEHFYQHISKSGTGYHRRALTHPDSDDNTGWLFTLACIHTHGLFTLWEVVWLQET